MAAPRHPSSSKENIWPELSLAAWKDSYETLHRYTQVVGKVKLALAPMMNHWWQVAMYVTSRGLSTSPIPYQEETFTIDFDFIDHELLIDTSWGERKKMALSPRPVAEFYRDVMATLRNLDIEVDIWDIPVEIPGDTTPFHEDQVHRAYNPEQVHRFWRALLQADMILKEFRARFTGKSSPVHFFWGSFDLAVTRFSGREAPPRPDADYVTQEAYAEEVISAGFWPGGGHIQEASFYAYAAPEPPGFSLSSVLPREAYYDKTLSEFLLPYEAVRGSENPRETLLAFLQSTYEAAAERAEWDRARLERPLITGPTEAEKKERPRPSLLTEQPPA